MKVETTKYFCDNCEEEMHKWEYDGGVKTLIQIEMPNPKGGCGETVGVRLVLCKKCAEEVGLINDAEIHRYIDDHIKFSKMLKENKQKILNLFKGKIKA